MTTDCKKCGAVYHTKVKGWTPKLVKCKCPFCKNTKEVYFRGDE